MQEAIFLNPSHAIKYATKKKKPVNVWIQGHQYPDLDMKLFYVLHKERADGHKHSSETLLVGYIKI